MLHVKEAFPENGLVNVQKSIDHYIHLTSCHILQKDHCEEIAHNKKLGTGKYYVISSILRINGVLQFFRFKFSVVRF